MGSEWGSMMSGESKKPEKEETVRARPVGLVQKGKDGTFEDAKPPSLLQNIGIQSASAAFVQGVYELLNGRTRILDRLSSDQKFANDFKGGKFNNLHGFYDTLEASLKHLKDAPNRGLLGGDFTKQYVQAETNALKALKDGGVARWEGLLNKNASSYWRSAQFVTGFGLIAGVGYYLLDKQKFEKKRAEFDADVKRGYVEIPASKIEQSGAAISGAVDAKSAREIK